MSFVSVFVNYKVNNKILQHISTAAVSRGQYKANEGTNNGQTFPVQHVLALT